MCSQHFTHLCPLALDIKDLTPPPHTHENGSAPDHTNSSNKPASYTVLKLELAAIYFQGPAYWLHVQSCVTLDGQSIKYVPPSHPHPLPPSVALVGCAYVDHGCPTSQTLSQLRLLVIVQPQHPLSA